MKNKFFSIQSEGTPQRQDKSLRIQHRRIAPENKIVAGSNSIKIKDFENRSFAQ